MVAATYDAAMVRVFADEGGYTNDPKDPGGPTNWGITIWDARKYWKPDATAEDVRAMPKAVASDIYRKRYASPLRYNDLPAGFDYSVLDAGINSGVGRAVPWAARALDRPAHTIDEVIPYSLASSDKVALIQKYWNIRVAFLHGLSTWSHFGAGWSRRCAQGEAAAVKMWLTVGAAMSAPDVRKTMNQQAGVAKSKAKTAATAGAGSAAGSAAPAHPSVDVSSLGLGGKIALGIVIALAIVLAVYFIRQAIIHSQRAAAYSAA